MKKYLLWLVVLVVSVSMIVSITLAGCKEEAAPVEEVVEEEEEAPAVEEAEEEAIEEEVAEEEEVGLVFWHLKTDQESRDIVQGAVDNFMKKYPNIKFDVLPIDTTLWTEKLQLALGGTDPPDIFWGSWGVRNIQWIADGLILDIDKEMREIENDISPGAIGGWVYNGKIMGAPHCEGAHFMVYNKETFDKYGLDIPNTWEEFKTVCESLKENGEIPIAWDAKDVWMGVHFFDKVLASFAGPDGKTACYNEMNGMERDPVVKTFSAMKELVTNGYIDPDALGYNWQEALFVFFNGDTAMFWGSSWEIPTYLEELGEPGDFKKFEYGVFPLPGPGLNNVRYGGSNGLMGFSGTKHPDEVKKFIIYWADYENSKYFIDTAFEGMNSNVKALKDSIDKLNYLQQEQYSLMTNPDYSTYFSIWGTSVAGGSSSENLGVIIQQVMWGDLTVEEGIESAVELFNSAIEELE